MANIIRHLSSVKLTLWLLIILAVVEASASWIPQEVEPADMAARFPELAEFLLEYGLDSFYTGWFHRALYLMLSINLLSCGVNRSVEGWRGFRGAGKPSVEWEVTSVNTLAGKLAGLGYSVAEGAAGISARKRSWGFLGFPLVHIAPLVILAGAVWGSEGGSVATQFVRLGTGVTTAFHWEERSDLPLPFALVVEEFKLEHYPIELEIGYMTEGGWKSLVVKEGEAAYLPEYDAELVVEKLHVETDDMTFHFVKDGYFVGPFNRSNVESAPVSVRPQRYKDLKVKRAEVLVELYGAGGAKIVSQPVAVNEPLVHDGYRIYMTAWDRDKMGQRIIGFQLVRDPGQWLVWVGSCVFTAGLFLLLFVEAGWVRLEGGVLIAKTTRGGVRRLREAMREE